MELEPSEGTPPLQTLEAWLGSIKLERYVDAFKDEGYDVLEFLLPLTEPEVEEVMCDVEMKKGHRKTFLPAWRQLTGAL